MRDWSLENDKLLSVTDVADDVIGLFDVDGRTLWVNASGEYLREYDGVKNEPFGHVHPEDRERVRAEFNNVVRTGEPRRLEFRVPQRDGSIRSIQSEATPMRDASGKVVGVLRIGRNVTEERRSEAALKATMQALLDQAPICISITDLEGRFLTTNRRMRGILGLEEEEVTRHNVGEFIYEADRPRAVALRRELVSGRIDHVAIEKRIVRPSGELRWVSCSQAIVRPPLGERNFVIELAEDITERKAVDAALREREERLEALTRRLVDVQETERRDIARELHDRVGQTLTAMRINMDMIRTRLADRDDPLIRARNDDSLDLIQSAFKAVEDVLHELRPPMIDEFGLVAALRWHAKRFADRTGIEVHVRGDEARRDEPATELALLRIAQEALHNVARHAQARRVDIEVRTSAAAVVLTIEDDGVGFDVDAREGAGVGYGLITMRERAEAVGGTFGAESGKGVGTRIRVRAPARS